MKNYWVNLYELLAGTVAVDEIGPDPSPEAIEEFKDASEILSLPDCRFECSISKILGR